MITSLQISSIGFHTSRYIDRLIAEPDNYESFEIVKRWIDDVNTDYPKLPVLMFDLQIKITLESHRIFAIDSIITALTEICISHPINIKMINHVGNSEIYTNHNNMLEFDNFNDSVEYTFEEKLALEASQDALLEDRNN